MTIVELQRRLPVMPLHERLALERRARLLAWGGNGWHVVEFGVAIVAGVVAASPALIGFSRHSPTGAGAPIEDTGTIARRSREVSVALPTNGDILARMIEIIGSWRGALITIAGATWDRPGSGSRAGRVAQETTKRGGLGGAV